MKEADGRAHFIHLVGQFGYLRVREIHCVLAIYVQQIPQVDRTGHDRWGRPAASWAGGAEPGDCRMPQTACIPRHTGPQSTCTAKCLRAMIMAEWGEWAGRGVGGSTSGSSRNWLAWSAPQVLFARGKLSKRSHGILYALQYATFVLRSVVRTNGRGRHITVHKYVFVSPVLRWNYFAMIPTSPPSFTPALEKHMPRYNSTRVCLSNAS